MATTNPFITQANPMQQAMIDPEAQALQRQKQYAAMLLQQNQQPQGQMVGGHFVAPSWTQQLNAALSPVVGAYMMNQSDKEQEKLAEKLRKETAQGLMEYNKLRYGTSATPATFDYGNNEADQIATMTSKGNAAIPADPAAAYAYALQSKSPVVNQMAMEMLKPQKMGEGERLVVFNPNTGKEEVLLQGGQKYHAPTHVDLGDKVMIQYSDGRVQYIPKSKSALQDISQLGGLRGQFINEAAPHVQIANAYQKVTSAPETAAGDMSKIFGFMKILDPGSTVREGEYASAENARGVGEKTRALYNKVISGEKLTPSQRAEFDQAAAALVKSQQDQYKRTIEKHYTNITTKAGVQPDLVISNPYEGVEIKTPKAPVVSPLNTQGTGRYNPLKTPIGANQAMGFPSVNDIDAELEKRKK
jgi:hypothetical protein